MNFLSFPLILVIEVLFLVVLSVIDYKTFNKEHGGIPSMVTSAFLVIVLFLTGPNGLYLGALAGLLALFLVDIGLIKGIPDIKVLIAIGMSLDNPIKMLVWVALTLLLGVIFSWATIRLSKSLYGVELAEGKTEIPYIPVMTISFLLFQGVLVL